MATVTLDFRGYETMKTRLAINRIDYLPELSRIRVPAMCAVGSISWPLSVPYMQKTADALPGCKQLHVIEDAYDPSNLCQVEVFNRLFGTFLRTVV